MPLETSKDYKRFNPKFDVFNRTVWDDVDAKNFFVSYDIANFAPKKSQGFDHWDYALRNASWHLTDYLGERHAHESGKVEGFTHPFSLNSNGSKSKVALGSPPEVSRRIKRAAELLGAGLVGITSIDSRWVYSHQYNRKTKENPSFDLPRHLKYVIMLALPMDFQLSRTFPSAISGATTGIGYADSLKASTALAQFITNLGFDAMASMNDTALNIPLAIAAGLGEYGRNGLLITKKYGPNVRLAKVFTDLPMELDSQQDFGVTAFCSICRKCSSSCPPRAIPDAEPQEVPPNISSSAHIKKWTVDAEKCFKFWVGMNSDCAICIRVCPYHRDYTKWWNRALLKLSEKRYLRRIVLWLDDKLSAGSRMSPTSWWSKANNTTPSAPT